jgi:catechol 2,3-dioxygenase-like lactoylglutathione lyase family enzyme
MTDGGFAFDNIGIATTDLERSLSFYQLLGFVAGEPEDGAALVRNGGASLYIFATGTVSSDPGRRLDMQGNASGIDHISFRVSDVDAWAQELRGRAVSIESGPENQSWGSRTFTVLDPDGNRLWFLGDLLD